jgi:hypothetical protein
MRPALSSALLALPLLFGARQAFGQAAGSNVELDWDAPSECPTGASVTAEIERILAGSPSRSARMRVQATASRVSADKWHVELYLRGAEWEAKRGLDGPTCAAVSDAAALVIALAINPEVERPAPSVKPAPLSKPEPGIEPRAPIATPTFAGPALGVGAVGDAGAVPDGTVGIEGNFGWTIGSVHTELSGMYFLERRGTLAERNDVGATFRLGAMSLRGCYQFARERLAFGPCVDVGLQWTSAQGFGPVAVYQVSGVAPIIGGALGAEWLVSRFFVPYARLGGMVPLARPDFAVQGMGHVHRAAIVSFRGTVGFEVHLD